MGLPSSWYYYKWVVRSPKIIGHCCCHKFSSLRRWRSAITIVKNRRKRFYMITDLEKRTKVKRNRQRIQEKIRVALYVQKAALQFIDSFCGFLKIGKESAL
ncbi:Calcium-transporting P-type ATPase, N-terminal autoinhibitory domain [Dillenia turbinata]|uniref:Calcium-transporting P-type ATPase, N-terminal autoinhibitory domain n=1 Tax=Dillenia turbinata TaxID=194707 RepID=A0AAN8UQV6_9MAGN